MKESNKEIRKIEKMMRSESGTLSGRKLVILDSRVNKLSGRGLYATRSFSKGDYITFFGFPRDERDSYGYKHRLPQLNDHVYRLNGVLYDNKGDADLFIRKNSMCYVPDQTFGYSVGLGWAVNSCQGNLHLKNCVMRKIRTFPLCPHITCTDRRFAKMDYVILEASRNILGGEEILYNYNLDGNASRNKKNISA